MSSFRPRLSPLALTALAGALVSGCDSPHYQPTWASKPALAATAPGRPIPAGSFEGASRSLLNEYESRDPVPREEPLTWALPFNAKRIVVGLLIMAARDDFRDLGLIVARDARWGIPDRRELEATKILADGGGRFMEAFRAAASRFDAKAAFNCPPIPNQLQDYVRGGAEPMWCFYLSQDRTDVLAFKLVVEGGAAKIGYVGLFPERPNGSFAVPPGNDSPPMVPQMIRRRFEPGPPLLRPAPAAPTDPSVAAPEAPAAAPASAPE